MGQRSSTVSSLATLSAGFSWRSEGLSWPVRTDIGPGLAGVIAAETGVCWLDPSSGLLRYRDVPIEALAHGRCFEEVAHLVINGRLPEEDPSGYGRFRSRLEASWSLPEDVEKMVSALDPRVHPLRILRTAISAMGCHELGAEDDLAGEQQWQELRIVGQVASLVARIVRHSKRLPALVLDPAQGMATCLVRALADREPTREEVQALDLLLILYTAHGLDAPTFASLVVASCLADPYTNVVAGLSALSGERVGGAGERVLEQILPLRDEADARRWVGEALARGEKIAGFGHRLYRMPDPRVGLLRKSTAVLAREAGRSRLFEVARAVEEEAHRRLAPRGVHVNVNLYAAPLVSLLGAAPSLFPCLVAVGRMAGVVAMVKEALGKIRLYRPLSRYVGHPARDVPAGRDRDR
jgi:citrate synthase